MTIFEKLKSLDEDEMAEFLYRFAKDVIDQFGHFVMADKNEIVNFLKRECSD